MTQLLLPGASSGTSACIQGMEPDDIRDTNLAGQLPSHASEIFSSKVSAAALQGHWIYCQHICAWPTCAMSHWAAVCAARSAALLTAVLRVQVPSSDSTAVVAKYCSSGCCSSRSTNSSPPSSQKLEV
jgi:hypothetical protein